MYRIMMLTILCLLSTSINAEIITTEITYKVSDKKYTGYIAFDDAMTEKRPGILILHEWWGHDDYARQRARKLAKLGYTAFALDMYGTGIHADHPKDANNLMTSLFSDMTEVKKRFHAARRILMDHPTVKKDKIAAIGYCMGGGLALNMARSGEDLDGVIVLHGSLGTKLPTKQGQIKARLLVLTGGLDSFVPPEQVQAFKKEMDDARVQYEVKVYPQAKHSFSVPGSELLGKKFKLPMAYNKMADDDSWQRIQVFLNDVFE